MAGRIWSPGKMFWGSLKSHGKFLEFFVSKRVGTLLLQCRLLLLLLNHETTWSLCRQEVITERRDCAGIKPLHTVDWRMDYSALSTYQIPWHWTTVGQSLSTSIILSHTSVRVLLFLIQMFCFLRKFSLLLVNFYWHNFCFVLLCCV